MTHLPSVGIAGIPNAGKSTLFNALLDMPRSLISNHRKTTRDVLEAVLDLPHDRCVMFDCAGLLVQEEGVLDQLAQQAALQSLGRSDLVLFCVDLSKSDWQEDLAIRRRVAAKALMGVATKADLLEPTERAGRLVELTRTLGESFLPVSAETGMNLLCVRDMIEQRLLSGRSWSDLSDAGQVDTMITARFRQTGTEAIDQLNQALHALEHGQADIAAMMVRAAYQTLSEVNHPVDEKVLDILFSRFCIGK
jgi:tRNA modification GTPase